MGFSLVTFRILIYTIRASSRLRMALGRALRARLPRARRPELSDEAQSCDFLAEEKELGTGQLPACATS